MNNVVSLAKVRSESLKQALATHGRNGATIIVETRSGTVSAEKFNCRDRSVEILDGFGDYFVIDYADIRSLQSAAAVAQTSVVNARGEFLPARNPATATGPVVILPFYAAQSPQIGEIKRYQEGRRNSGSPIRIRMPSPMPGWSSKPSGANTMMVEPCSNQPISWPLARLTLQGMALAPR